MHSIVMSLKSAEARRKHIEKEFGQQNVAFSFFDALTPDLAKPLAEKMQLNIAEGALTQGELACFMSHVSIWQKIVDEQIAQAAIFEDDVYLGENADYFLNHEEWIHADWNIIKLEAFSKKILHERKGISLEKDRQLFKLKDRHVGAAGYILSLKAAQYLLNLLKENEIREPLDHILFDPKYHSPEYPLYQMKPAICIQSYLYVKDEGQAKFDSTLENQRIARRDNESKARTLGEKLNRELRRLNQQMHTSWYKKTLEFK